MGIEMSKGIITLLIVTNLATGYQAWVYHQRHQAAISDKTTDREREIYGAACVDWLSEKVTEDDITFLPLLDAVVAVFAEGLQVVPVPELSQFPLCALM